MGTIMNGKKWIGAYVNGNIVSGLAKNGFVFYKKEKNIYKRRIMIGDNLKGKTIYSDFPNNYVNYFSNIFDNIKTNIISIEKPDIQYNIVENIEYYESDITLSIDGNNSSIGLISAIYVGNTIFGDLINNSMVDFRNDSDYIVSLIQSDNSSYRHLYIEDSNIRPLQTGDIIKKGTKLYFTFPDEFGYDLATYSGQTLVSTNSNVDFGTLKFLTYLGSGITRAADPYYDYLYVTDSINSSDENRIAIMAFEKVMTNSLEKNLSVYVFTSNNMATVTNIRSQFNEYVLVDTTTLG